MGSIRRFIEIAGIPANIALGGFHSGRAEASRRKGHDTLAIFHEARFAHHGARIFERVFGQHSTTAKHLRNFRREIPLA